MNETKYRNQLEKRIAGIFPGCLILRNNPDEIQGIPDLTVLYGMRWAMLEIKISADAPTQPNQPYYINWLSDMSFAAFIYPENEEQIISELIEFFELEGWDL